MKTRTNTTPKGTNRMSELSRLSIIIVGIVTVLIGALTLSYEAKPVKSYMSVNRMIGTSKVAVTDFSLQIAPKVAASVLWP